VVVSLAALAWWAVAPSRPAIGVVRTTMGAMMAFAIVGLWFHLQANLEFEREVSPSLQGLALFVKAIRGASPPSLAPAAFVQLGLLGFILTLVQPAPRRSRPTQEGEAS
jgi:hypothetical protein